MGLFVSMRRQDGGGWKGCGGGTGQWGERIGDDMAGKGDVPRLLRACARGTPKLQVRDLVGPADATPPLGAERKKESLSGRLGARVIAHYQDKARTGARVLDVKSGTLAAKCGLRTGDVVKRIGDQLAIMDAPERAVLGACLSKTPLMIERAGQPRTLRQADDEP